MEKTILIVDDIPLMRMMLQKYLQTINKVFSEEQNHSIQFTIIEATNGREAIEKISENTVDLIFLDLMMPEVDGFGFLEKKEKELNKKSIPVVITSAQCEQENLQQTREYNIAAYLTKPFTIKALQQQVENILLKENRE